jgi:hypothetical protein
MELVRWFVSQNLVFKSLNEFLKTIATVRLHEEASEVMKSVSWKKMQCPPKLGIK